MAKRTSTPVQPRTIVVDGITYVQAPATAAPAAAKAEAPFLTFLKAKAAAKVACTLHAPSACTRRFSPTSAGVTNHVAKLV